MLKKFLLLQTTKWKFLWSLDGLIPELLQLLYCTSAQDNANNSLNDSFGDPWHKNRPILYNLKPDISSRLFIILNKNCMLDLQYMIRSTWRVSWKRLCQVQQSFDYWAYCYHKTNNYWYLDNPLQYFSY